MKKKLALCFGLVVVLCMGMFLTACGGSADKTADYQKAFLGKWKCVEISTTEESVSREDMQMMEEYGMYILLDFKEDGKVSFDMMGEVEELTWKVTGENKAEGKWESEGTTEDVNYDIKDGQLSLSQGEDKFIFEPYTEEAQAETGK